MLRFLLGCVPAVLFLSACGPSARDVTPSMGAEAVFTSAAETFSAQLATQKALSTPTKTSPPSPYPTLPPPLPLATISFASSTPLAEDSGDCNNAIFVADVTIPDKTQLNPGQKFAKTWLVQNTGTCPWTTDYRISFVDGLQMDGSDAYVPIGVPVGTQVEMTVSLKAPTSPGDYYGRWVMQNKEKQPFGSFLTVVIKVIPLP